jgi:hypothetical protein
MNTSIRIRVMALGLMCSAVWSSQLLAGNPAPKVPDGPTVDFAKADKNGDGRISKEESLLVPDLGSAFEMLDSDQDELISRTEFSHWSRAGEVEPPASDPAVPPGGDTGSGNMTED